MGHITNLFSKRFTNEWLIQIKKVMMQINFKREQESYLV